MRWNTNGPRTHESHGVGAVEITGAAQLEEFITARQWAYQPRRNPRRYAAEREPWLLNAPYAYDVECDFSALSQGLMPNPGRLPDSVLLADGGPVRITTPERIKPLQSQNNQR